MIHDVSPAENHRRAATGANGRPTVCHLLLQMDYGGAEVLARQYALHQRGEFNVVLACLDTLGAIGERLQQDGFVVEPLARRPGVDFGCVLRLRKFLHENNVDLVHAHQFSPYFYAALARGLRSTPRILFHEHGRGWPDYRRWKRVLANRFLLRRGDRAVAVGNQVREALVAHEGIPRERIEVIYNGIDLARFETPRGRTEGRCELGLAESDLVVAQVARLVELKDYPTALGAIKQCAADFPQLRYLIVGDGPERGAIESLVAELELAEHVRLLGTREDVAEILAASDIFLLTSVTEGIPLTVIEAMAAGLPCVATDVGGVSEIIVDGKTGLLAPATDQAAIARQLKRLAGDPHLRTTLGEAGRRRAVNHFDEQQMQQAFVTMYRHLLGQPTAGAAEPPQH